MPSSPRPTRLVDVVVDVLLALLILLSVAALLLDFAWGLVGLAVALLGLSAQLVRERAAEEAGWSPLGSSPALRALVVAGTAVALARGGDDGPAGPELAAGLGAAVLVGSLACEPLLARAAQFQVPVAVRLPGLPAVPRYRNLGPYAVVTSLLATGAGLLLVALKASAWWWLPVVVLAVLPTGLIAVTGRAKILLARRLRQQVKQAVTAYAPEFVLYTSRPDDASYQVQMWLPYLKRSGLRFLIVTRNAVPAAALAEQTDVPVVEARRMADLDALVVPSVKAAFYVNASSGNGALVRFQHLTHVYLGHGDSDKPPSYNPTHALYDVVFAAGPAATRRYAAHGVQIPSEKFRIVGRPQVADVRPTNREIADVVQPTVLYAPTWRGHVEETMLYSLPDGERIVSALLARGSTVVFRPHPFSYEFPEDAVVIRAVQALLAEDARRTGRQHLWGGAAETERGILDCINLSDAMVSDVSSVVSDYLFSGKPFAMVAVPSEPRAFVAEYPVAAASYVLRGDLTDLDEQLDSMLGADPRRAERLAFRVDYLGDFPAEGYADAFVRAVQQVTTQPVGDEDAAEHADFDGDEGPGEDDDQRSLGPPDAPDTDGEDRPGDTISASAASDRGRRGSDLGRYRGLLQRVGLELLGTGLALLALAFVLLRAPSWSVALLALAAVGAVLLSASTTVGRSSERSRFLAKGLGARAVLLVTLAVLAVDQGAPTWFTTRALLLLAASAVAEGRIAAAWQSFGLIAHNLPAALPPLRHPVDRGMLPLASFAAVALGFVLLGALPNVPTRPITPRTGAAVLLVVAAAVFVLCVHLLERALRRASAAVTGESRLRGALEQLEPEFAVYFASTVGASYQVGMWLPYFVRIGRPFVILTRTVPMLGQIARLCEEQGLDVPVVHRPTLRSLEDVLVPSMTSAFYVNNAVRNTHFIERRELTHVWLNHGDSEKPACYNPVHAVYDLIFAAGQAGIDRYARHGVQIPREKFRVVGRPQVEQVEPARGPVAEQQPPTVLYAPTWQGPYADTRVYSLPLGTAIVTALLKRGVRVVFRAHPFNYRYAESQTMIAEIGALLDADRGRTGRNHLWGPAAERELSVEDCFNLSDAMVSDVSAVVSDYLRSDKPFAMVSVGRTPEQLVVEAPAARAAYVLREDLSNLDGVLDDLLGADPLAAARIQTRVYYLGDFPPGHYADGFLDAARQVIDAGHALPGVTAVPEPA